MARNQEEHTKRIQELAKRDLERIKPLAAEIINQAEEDWGIVINSDLKSNNMSKSCSYCGSRPAMQSQGNSGIFECSICKQSKGTQSESLWLKKIKAQNVVLWGKIIRNNSSSSTPISKRIQKIADDEK
jgi:hypothetical protein